jgi:fluoride exporter
MAERGLSLAHTTIMRWIQHYAPEFEKRWNRFAPLIAVGGALGTLARYLISVAAVPFSHTLPWGTILINVSGSFVIGFFGTLTLSQGRYPLPETARLFVMVGFCGGFTTFSSFSLQTLDLMRQGLLTRALINVAASVVLCVGAVAIGHALAAKLNGVAAEIVQNEIEEEV